MEQPKWYALCYSLDGRVRPYNVLEDHTDTIRKFKEKSKSLQEFSKMLRTEMCYWYCEQIEWEIFCSLPCPNDAMQKIDVYSQLVMNWDIFAEYCWKSF